MLITSIIIFLLIGGLAGLLAGLLGISGGIITIPLLVLMFNVLDINESCLMQMAIGTSLASMVFNAIASTWAHHKKRGVLWPLLWVMSPGIIIGSVLGALGAKLMPSDTLKLIFGIFACVLGIYFMWKVEIIVEREHRLPGKLGLNGVGLGIGGLSNILGIGGGIVTVPVLMAFHVRPKKAIGTSAASSLLISFMGASSYLYFGLHANCGQPPMTLGFIYIPAFVAISIASVIVAPFGAKLTQILKPALLRRIFGGALIITGLLMIFD